jgi:rubrerythrin
MSDDCPDEYGAGLLFAFKDEQNTVDFYLDIADKAADPVMREAFRRAAADEQSHAVWFQHFIMQRR